LGLGQSINVLGERSAPRVGPLARRDQLAHPGPAPSEALARTYTRKYTAPRRGHARERLLLMGQITLYLDADTERTLKAEATASGVSLSRWVAGAIRAQAGDRWPASVAALAGAWADLPEVEALRAAEGEDVPREPL
jgi:hypothetical protein